MSSHAWRQRVKWIVYTLLLIDFALYLYQDWESADYTLGADPSLLDWARAYVTSIDLAAWFALILLFELETYVYAGRPWRGASRRGVHAVRVLCYACILHTTFTDAAILRAFYAPELLPAAADLCDYTHDDWSFLRNRGYTYVDAENCKDIGTGTDYYVIASEPVITDRAGLREGLILAWTDLVENVAWLLIVLGNEIVVRLQSRGVRAGVLLTALDRSKAGLYTLIVLIALYWGSKGQMFYLWDEVLWVCGFLAIEKNLFDWRLRQVAPPGIASG